MSDGVKDTLKERCQFLEREAELENLRNAWEEVINGKPQIRVIAAESGYGKTKLVQAFYAWLSANQNYWPPCLAEDGENLRVMPQLSHVASGNRVPWFWWGIRWVADPDGRNLPEECNPFISSFNDPSFISHQSAMLLSVNERQALKEVLIASCKVVLGIVGAGLPKDLFDAIEQIRGFLGILKKHRSGVDLSKGKTAAEALAFDRVLTTFALMLDPFKGNKGSLPVTLVLDDAHWMDDLSVTIVDRLWSEAQARSWPLLVIATTWQKEWNKGTAFSEWAKPTFRKHPNVDYLIELKRLSDESIGQILSTAFPGLTVDQRLFFASKADGNPLLAVEITMLLKDMVDEWFENGDISQCLDESGFASARSQQFELEHLERKRFRKVEADVKDALGLGSGQGVVFLCKFAVEVAQCLGLRGANRAAFEKAENPLALAESIDLESMEFRSKFLHQLAGEHLTSKRLEPALSAAIAKVAHSWMLKGRLEELTSETANRLLASIVIAYPTKMDKISTAAHSLALFGKDPSGWFLAKWTARWLGFKVTPKELRLVATDVLRDAAKALWKAGEKEGGLIVALEVERRAINSAENPSERARYQKEEGLKVAPEVERARYLMLSTYMKDQLNRAPADEIIRSYDEVVRLRRKTAEQKDDAKSWRRLALTYDAFGRFLEKNESPGSHDTRRTQARETFQESIRASQEAIRRGETEKSMLELALSLRHMAEFLRRAFGDLADAYENSCKSVELYREILRRFPPTFGKIEDLARALLTHASIESDRGNNEEALRFTDEAIKELEFLLEISITPTNFSIYDRCLRLKADCLLKIKGKASALQCLQTALRTCEKTLSINPQHPDLLESKDKLVSLIDKMRAKNQPREH